MSLVVICVLTISNDCSVFTHIYSMIQTCLLSLQLMVQAAAQQETLQRQVAIERDRLCLPPWNGQ